MRLFARNPISEMAKPSFGLILLVGVVLVISACMPSIIHRAENGDIDGMKKLLDAGANANLTGPLWITPLVAAVISRHYEAAQFLLDHGADINYRMENGRTALHSVVKETTETRMTDGVRFLLEHGADPTLLDDDGKLARDYAYAPSDPPEAKELLKQAEERFSRKAARQGRRQAREKVLQAELVKNISVIAAAEKAGDDAKAAGNMKEALARYQEALKATPPGAEPDRRLREKIIAVAAALNPPPAVPEEAESLANRGQSLIKRAQNADEMQLAVSKLQEATLLAPWWATAYFNLGLAQERAEDFDGAMQSLRLYLLAAPNADDVKAVRRKLDDLASAKELAEKREK